MKMATSQDLLPALKVRFSTSPRCKIYQYQVNFKEEMRISNGLIFT